MVCSANSSRTYMDATMLPISGYKHRLKNKYNVKGIKKISHIFFFFFCIIVTVSFCWQNKHRKQCTVPLGMYRLKLEEKRPFNYYQSTITINVKLKSSMDFRTVFLIQTTLA